MKATIATVIIPTRKRLKSLAKTLQSLRQQDIGAGNLVVGDGSSAPVPSDLPNVGLVLHLEGKERSAVRNAGGRAAREGTLILVDDNLTLVPHFVRTRCEAQGAWPCGLGLAASWAGYPWLERARRLKRAPGSPA